MNESSQITPEEREIQRLREIIKKAKSESEFIHHNDKPFLLVPYWFIHAQIEPENIAPHVTPHVARYSPRN